MLFRSITDQHVGRGVIARQQQDDDDYVRELRHMCEVVNRSEQEEMELPNLTHVRDAIQRFVIKDNLVCRIEYGAEDEPDMAPRYPVVVPKSRQQEVLQYVHDTYGHPRGSRFVACLRARY